MRFQRRLGLAVFSHMNMFIFPEKKIIPLNSSLHFPLVDVHHSFYCPLQGLFLVRTTTSSAKLQPLAKLSIMSTSGDSTQPRLFVLNQSIE